MTLRELLAHRAGVIGTDDGFTAEELADPRSGLAYGYTRRRFAFPGGAAPENEQLAKAVHTAALAS